MSTIEEEVPQHLRGNWAPLQGERTLTGLEAVGTIPASTAG